MEWYKKCFDLANWIQEKYMCCIYISQLTEDKNEEIFYSLKSAEYDPERIEGIVHAMEHYRATEYKILVQALYYKYKDYKYRAEGKLFVDKSKYNDYIEFNYSIVAFYLHDYKVGYQCCKQIILNGIIDFPSLRTTLQNIVFYESVIRSDPDTLSLFYKVNDLFKLIDNHNTPIHSAHQHIFNLLFEINKPKICAPKEYHFKNRDNPIVFLSFTTCKRLPLFLQTMFSILNHWTDVDKIDYWFCVDDNSSKEDREKMKKTFPWIDYYWKNEKEKGHRDSMNIIWNHLDDLRPKYWIHLEDDFVFHKKLPYVQDALDGLTHFEDSNVKQVMFNRSYAETVKDYKIRSHVVNPSAKYVIHDHKPGNFPYSNCHYWPHYSFLPSLVEVAPILEIGNYNSKNTFFERDYADKWNARGYKTAFFNSINTHHIGKMRGVKEGKNAYELNETNQF